MTEPLSPISPKGDDLAKLQFLDKLADKGINGATKDAVKKIFDDIEVLFPKLDFAERIIVLQRLTKIGLWNSPGILEKISNIFSRETIKPEEADQISAAAVETISNIFKKSKERENVTRDVDRAWYQYTNTKDPKKNAELVKSFALFNKTIGSYESESQLAFMAAVSSSNYAEVKRMILLKTVDVNAFTGGYTALRKAHLNQDQEMIKILLSAKDIDPNKRDAWGNLPNDLAPPVKASKVKPSKSENHKVQYYRQEKQEDLFNIKRFDNLPKTPDEENIVDSPDFDDESTWPEPDQDLK